MFEAKQSVIGKLYVSDHAFWRFDNASFRGRNPFGEVKMVIRAMSSHVYDELPPLNNKKSFLSHAHFIVNYVQYDRDAFLKSPAALTEWHQSRLYPQAPS